MLPHSSSHITVHSRRRRLVIHRQPVDRAAHRPTWPHCSSRAVCTADPPLTAGPAWRRGCSQAQWSSCSVHRPAATRAPVSPTLRSSPAQRGGWLSPPPTVTYSPLHRRFAHHPRSCCVVAQQLQRVVVALSLPQALSIADSPLCPHRRTGAWTPALCARAAPALAPCRRARSTSLASAPGRTSTPCVCTCPASRSLPRYRRGFALLHVFRAGRQSRACGRTVRDGSAVGTDCAGGRTVRAASHCGPLRLGV